MLFLLYHPVCECFNNRKMRRGSSEHSGKDKNEFSRGIPKFQEEHAWVEIGMRVMEKDQNIGVYDKLKINSKKEDHRMLGVAQKGRLK